jgi:hypothetical protein
MTTKDMDLDRITVSSGLVAANVRQMAKRRIAWERRNAAQGSADAVTSNRPVRRNRAVLAAGILVLVVVVAVIVVAYVRAGNQALALLAPNGVPTASVAAVPAEPKVDLVDMGTVLFAVGHAKTITLAAFSLRHDATIVRALEAASARGARVSVVLARGFGFYSQQNAETTRELSAHGVRVHRVGFSQRPTHIKAAVLDGQLYLSDRNWTSRSADAIVVHDSIPGDRVLIERSFLGRSAANDHLWTRKADALWAEANMLATAHSRAIRVSTESFGLDTAVYRRLVQRRKAGDDVSLLIARSEYAHNWAEHMAVAPLLAIGVRVRLSSSNEKMAIDGAMVWIGSANATKGLPNQLEFGIVITSSSVAEQLRKQFDEEWKKASPADGRQEGR